MTTTKAKQEELYLEGYSFIFSHKGYVTLDMEQSHDLLQNISVCLCSLSDSPYKQALFSYATKDQDKEILIYKVYGPDGFWWYTVYIGGVPQRFRVPDSYQAWQKICIRWSSETGVLSLEINGQTLARKVVRQGYFIKPHALVQLGRAHHEDVFFHGEIQQVYMWNTTGDNRYNPPMFGWSNLRYETQGNVALDNLSWPPYIC
ncbi:PREDICTED: serum amyloid P-component-like [Thamnophis sirtalis]|uniref:Pentraxin family member n=1 Tax=Thamnophis sirtalis TaxID=35019 RepID=A0A6I9XZJ6_9SAUR|nr:PREDICTED: serum amyloid P-component-like [Thamnophis sirtalis]